MPPKLLVLYVPSLDRRLIDPNTAPFLSRCLTRWSPIELETHPSVELLPTLVTGVWPHQHRIWQVRLKPESKRTTTERLIDLLPDRWTTTWQCVRHRWDPDYDLPTIEPRRRRRFELHRIKVQRRFGGGGTGSLHHDGVESLFSLLSGESTYRTIFSFADIPSDPSLLVTGEHVLDFLELYSFDLFCHWNLDRTSAVQTQLHFLDAVLEQLCIKAERLGLKALLVVDHGQERVRHTLNLRRVLNESGVSHSEYSFYIEVCNARFWFFTEHARKLLSQQLSRIEGAAFLTAAEMEKYHIHFAESEGFGDAYLIADPGTIFFPHDFYHPLVNWYMARNTAEQMARKSNPVHRGYHGHLPAKPVDTGYVAACTPGLEALAKKGELIDFAPSVLRLLRRPVPAQMAGKALFQ
jgi:hypothetical protein